MGEIIVLLVSKNGNGMFYDFNNYSEFESEFGYMSSFSYLKGAVLKGKLWEGRNWDELNKKIKRMRWAN